MTSRRPLVLELGGNTILFRLLTKPSFCSFPLLDDRKAPNGGICTEREEVSEEHEELNKIKILFNYEEREIGVLPPSRDFCVFFPVRHCLAIWLETQNPTVLFCEINYGI